MKHAKALKGKRVLLESLFYEGVFPGVISSVESPDKEQPPVCIVKLDRQEMPVQGVLYYETPPGEVKSTRCQICYP